jgi:hypothetical protein
MLGQYHYYPRHKSSINYNDCAIDYTSVNEALVSRYLFPYASVVTYFLGGL